MTRDELIQTLYDAGVIPPGYGGTANQFDAFHRFADIVAAHEREKCAEICDNEMANAKVCANIVYGNGMAVGAGNCADRIRALGDNDE